MTVELVDQAAGAAMEKKLEVRNRLGMHARAAARIAETVSGFDCSVELWHDQTCAQADSILAMLTLDAPQGTWLVVRAQGPQAAAAMASLEVLFADFFGEGS